MSNSKGAAMRLRDAVVRSALIGGLLLAAISGCSRLTFVKPNYKRGDYRQVAPEVRIDPKANSRGEAFTLVQVAQARLLDGDPAKAADAATRALRLEPDSAPAHSLLALALDALGRPTESGPHHRRAAELAPGNGALLNNYGTWLCGSGQAAASLDWFERAAQAPGYETPDAAWANAAACALTAGRADVAERDARQAIAIAPSNPLALSTLARLEFAAGRGLEARAFVQRRLAAAPADADTLLLASQIETSLGDAAASSRYVERLRTEFPPDSRPSGDKR